MTGDPVDQLAGALDDLERLVAAIADDQWAQPTPCTDWTVRELVNHVVGGNYLFAGILRGETTLPPLEIRSQQGRDRLGDDPLAAYHDASRQLITAFREPGVLDQTYELPIGRLPGTAAARLRVVETLVHGWDLAHSIGHPPEFSQEAAEQALEFSRGALAKLPPGRVFASPQPVADDARAIDRLAALLGRPLSAA